jgi:hypothetical protein
MTYKHSTEEFDKITVAGRLVYPVGSVRPLEANTRWIFFVAILPPINSNSHLGDNDLIAGFGDSEEQALQDAIKEATSYITSNQESSANLNKKG